MLSCRFCCTFLRLESIVFGHGCERAHCRIFTVCLSGHLLLIMCMQVYSEKELSSVFEELLTQLKNKVSSTCQSTTSMRCAALT